MRSLSLEDLLERAEENAADEKKTVEKCMNRSQVTLASIRDVSKKFPDKDPYTEPSAEANFKAKILNLLDDLTPIPKPETSLIERHIVQLNAFQIEVARTAARLIPRFDRSRKIEVAELELHLRELAKIAAQLKDIPMGSMRQEEEASQIIRRIRVQASELQQLQSARDLAMSEMKRLRDDEAKLDEQASVLRQSELSGKIESLDAEIKTLIRRIIELFVPIAKPAEKLRKLLEDRRSPTADIDPILKCVEDPLNLLRFEQTEMERAGHILRGYIERNELSIKQSRAKRALEAISELQAQAPAIRERLGPLQKSRMEVLSSKEASELSKKREEVDDRIKHMKRQLGVLETNQASLGMQIERSSHKLQHLKKEAEMLAKDIISEPVELTL